MKLLFTGLILLLSVGSAVGNVLLPMPESVVGERIPSLSVVASVVQSTALPPAMGSVDSKAAGTILIGLTPSESKASRND